MLKGTIWLQEDFHLLQENFSYFKRTIRLQEDFHLQEDFLFQKDFLATFKKIDVFGPNQGLWMYMCIVADQGPRGCQPADQFFYLPKKPNKSPEGAHQ